MTACKAQTAAFSPTCNSRSLCSSKALRGLCCHACAASLCCFRLQLMLSYELHSLARFLAPCQQQEQAGQGQGQQL